MKKPLKIIEPFGRLGRTEGDPGGTDPEGGVTVIYHAFRPETPSFTGKESLLKQELLQIAMLAFAITSPSRLTCSWNAYMIRVF